MTQKRLFLVALMCMIMSATTFASDRVITANQLPATAQTFINQTFPGATIMYAEIDDGKYEVHLNDGTEINFDRKGNWDKVDCKLKAVPAHLIPATIASNVETQFSGTVITKIDKERYGDEIELSNGLDLKFNRQGMLSEIDD